MVRLRTAALERGLREALPQPYGAAIPGGPAGSQRTMYYSLGAQDFAIALRRRLRLPFPTRPAGSARSRMKRLHVRQPSSEAGPTQEHVEFAELR